MSVVPAGHHADARRCGDLRLATVLLHHPRARESWSSSSATSDRFSATFGRCFGHCCCSAFSTSCSHDHSLRRRRAPLPGGAAHWHRAVGFLRRLDERRAAEASSHVRACFASSRSHASRFPLPRRRPRPRTFALGLVVVLVLAAVDGVQRELDLAVPLAHRHRPDRLRSRHLTLSERSLRPLSRPAADLGDRAAAHFLGKPDHLHDRLRTGAVSRVRALEPVCCRRFRSRAIRSWERDHRPSRRSWAASTRC